MPDPDTRLSKVCLCAGDHATARRAPFDYNEDTRTGSCEFPLPDADRMEYMFELVYPDGRDEYDLRPHQPVARAGTLRRQVGASSSPDTNPRSGSRRRRDARDIDRDDDPQPRPLRMPNCRRRVVARRAEAGRPAPALDRARRARVRRVSSLTDAVATADRAQGRCRRCGPCSVAPVDDRDQIYSASAAYSRALTYEILPAVDARPDPSRARMRVGMGASLGALAMLHVHRISPASFGALFLQSGSYFRQRYDKQESGFVRFRRISRFMGRVLTADGWAHPIPVNDDLRDDRGEPREQPSDPRGARTTGLRRAPSSRTETGTTGSPGATRSTLTWSNLLSKVWT